MSLHAWQKKVSVFGADDAIGAEFSEPGGKLFLHARAAVGTFKRFWRYHQIPKSLFLKQVKLRKLGLLLRVARQLLVL